MNDWPRSAKYFKRNGLSSAPSSCAEFRIVATEQILNALLGNQYDYQCVSFLVKWAKSEQCKSIDCKTLANYSKIKDFVQLEMDNAYLQAHAEADQELENLRKVKCEIIDHDAVAEFLKQTEEYEDGREFGYDAVLERAIQKANASYEKGSCK
jgi:hypothetical protein